MAERVFVAGVGMVPFSPRALDTFVQPHGGYGYMLEYPIAKAWADSRVSRIYGGSTEIMKEIIGRPLELG
jgi:alkylation response protein AidB-like acyl-CoA dehydrogenase